MQGKNGKTKRLSVKDNRLKSRKPKAETPPQIIKYRETAHVSNSESGMASQMPEIPATRGSRGKREPKGRSLEAKRT